ncbi:17434_t:CDS:2, partial [Funneliformis geosporum]
ISLEANDQFVDIQRTEQGLTHGVDFAKRGKTRLCCFRTSRWIIFFMAFAKATPVDNNDEDILKRAVFVKCGGVDCNLNGRKCCDSPPTCVRKSQPCPKPGGGNQ